MLQTSLRGAVAGAVATVVMTLEQPLDKRLFDSNYDDVEILGKLVTRGDDWQPIGFALHVQNGAILGAAYARLKPSLPRSAVLRGLLVGLIEHAAWGEGHGDPNVREAIRFAERWVARDLTSLAGGLTSG